MPDSACHPGTACIVDGASKEEADGPASMFWAASVNVVGNLFSGSICAAASSGFANLKSDGRDACESCAAARAGWNGAISCLTLSERCVQLLEACSKASAEATLGGMPIACETRNEVSSSAVRAA